MTPMIKERTLMTNSKALRKLANGVKIASNTWNPNKFLELSEIGKLIDNSEALVDWNEMATSFKDTWIKVD